MKIVKEVRYWVFSMMNPDGYMSFPEHLENVFEK